MFIPNITKYKISLQMIRMISRKKNLATKMLSFAPAHKILALLNLPEAKAQMSLSIRAVSSEPLLFRYTKNGSRGSSNQKFGL